jgi:hypothetical protein
MQGMSVSFTETGAFGFACSRGMVSMQNPVEITEIFIPAKTYIKIPGGVTGPLPHGKSWISASSLVTWARTSSSPDRATRVLRWPQRSQVQAILDLAATRPSGRSDSFSEPIVASTAVGS